MQWYELDDRNKSISAEPWNLYWSESKTGMPDFEDFLHDPISMLSQDINEIDETWSIISTIVNHEVGLQNSISCQILMADPRKKVAYLTYFKHP